MRRNDPREKRLRWARGQQAALLQKYLLSCMEGSKITGIKRDMDGNIIYSSLSLQLAERISGLDDIISELG